MAGNRKGYTDRGPISIPKEPDNLPGNILRGAAAIQKALEDPKLASLDELDVFHLGEAPAQPSGNEQREVAPEGRKKTLNEQLAEAVANTTKQADATKEKPPELTDEERKYLEEWEKRHNQLTNRSP